MEMSDSSDYKRYWNMNLAQWILQFEHMNYAFSQIWVRTVGELIKDVSDIVLTGFIYYKNLAKPQFEF